MRGKVSLKRHHRSTMDGSESKERQNQDVRDNFEKERPKSESFSYKEIKEDEQSERAPSTSSQKNVNKVFIMDDEEEAEDDVFEDHHISNTIRSHTKSPRFDEQISYDASNEVVLRPHHQRVRAISASLSSRSVNSPQKSYSSGDLQGYQLLNTRRTVSNKNSKKDDMVLQLVIPSNSNSPLQNSESIGFPTPPSIEEILGQNHLKDRTTNKMNSHYSSNTDMYSSVFNGGSPYSRNQSYMDLGEFAKSSSNNNNHNYGLHKVASVERFTPALSTRSDIYQPTPAAAKKRAFRDLLTTVLSVLYALFIITLGLAVYVTDLIEASGDNGELFSLAENFSLFMVISSFLFILYLTIDIVVYMRKKAAYEKLLEKNTPEQIEIKETPDGSYELNIKLPEMVKQMGKTLEHHYCFNKDRHSANFYLKIGAVGFCFGHLIHCGLLLGYRFVFIANSDTEFDDCVGISTIILEFIYPLYSFLLLYFIFKYSNVIINRHIVLARFGLMHCFSASLCFWMWTIFRETIEYLANNKKEYDYDDHSDTPPLQSQKVSETVSIVGIEVYRFTKICEGDSQLRVIYQNYSPYLYPFSVEYSILVVGILYILWKNIALCHENFNHEDEHGTDTKECANPKSEEPESNIAIHVDCHASNKGLFSGIVALLFTVISVILFFIAIYDEDSDLADQGLLVNTISSLILVSVMLLSCLVAYKQITQLDVNMAAHNQLDNILLLICIPAFFFNGIFSILPAILYNEVLAACWVSVETVQVVIQTVFIMDGMQRCSNTKQLRQKKPGRELVTFLVICNVAMWIMQTFEVKSHGLHDYRYEFYSKELWSILGHMCLPLMMFYRFHSSVCLGDIWKYGYVPAGH